MEVEMERAMSERGSSSKRKTEVDFWTVENYLIWKTGYFFAGSIIQHPKLSNVRPQVLRKKSIKAFFWPTHQFIENVYHSPTDFLPMCDYFYIYENHAVVILSLLIWCQKPDILFLQQLISLLDYLSPSSHYCSAMTNASYKNVSKKKHRYFSGLYTRTWIFWGDRENFLISYRIFLFSNDKCVLQEHLKEETSVFLRPLYGDMRTFFWMLTELFYFLLKFFVQEWQMCLTRTSRRRSVGTSPTSIQPSWTPPGATALSCSPPVSMAPGLYLVSWIKII